MLGVGSAVVVSSEMPHSCCDPTSLCPSWSTKDGPEDRLRCPGLVALSHAGDEEDRPEGWG